MDFHIRVDAKALKDYASLEEWVRANCDAYLVSYETPVDNPHYQGYIRTLKKVTTLRKSLTKLLTLKGNTAYSISQCREKEKLLQYCCKDGDIRLTTFTDEEVETYKRIGAETKAEVEKSVERRKAKPLNTIAKLYKELDCSRNVKLIFVDVVKWYAANDKCFPDCMMMKRIAQTLRFKWLTQNGHQCEKFINALVEQAFGGWVGCPGNFDENPGEIIF